MSEGSASWELLQDLCSCFSLLEQTCQVYLLLTKALLSHLQGLQVAQVPSGIGVTGSFQVALMEEHSFTPTLQCSGHLRATPAVTGKKSGLKLSLLNSACSAGTQEQETCPHRWVLVTGTSEWQPELCWLHVPYFKGRSLMALIPSSRWFFIASSSRWPWFHLLHEFQGGCINQAKPAEEAAPPLIKAGSEVEFSLEGPCLLTGTNHKVRGEGCCWCSLCTEKSISKHWATEHQFFCIF